MYSFLGCEKEKPCLKRGVKRQNLCLKRGVKKQKLCLRKGCEKAKTWSQKLVDQSYFPIFSSFMNYVYSTPQISERIPFLLCFLTGVSVRTFECRGYLFFHAARGIGPLLEFLYFSHDMTNKDIGNERHERRTRLAGSIKSHANAKRKR